MITIDMIASWFGGSIPSWFWTLGSIIFAIVVIVLCLQPKKKGGGASRGADPNKPVVKVSRNSDGSYYAYDAGSGAVLYSAATQEEVNEWKKTNYPSANPRTYRPHP